MDALGRLIRFSERYQQVIGQVTSTAPLATIPTSSSSTNSVLANEAVGCGASLEERLHPLTSAPLCKQSSNYGSTTSSNGEREGEGERGFQYFSNNATSRNLSVFPPMTAYYAGGTEPMLPLHYSNTGSGVQWRSPLPQWYSGLSSSSTTSSAPAMPPAVETSQPTAPTRSTTTNGTHALSDSSNTANTSMTAAAFFTGYAAAAALPYHGFSYFPASAPTTSSSFNSLIAPATPFAGIGTNSQSANALASFSLLPQLIPGVEQLANNHHSTGLMSKLGRAATNGDEEPTIKDPTAVVPVNKTSRRYDAKGRSVGTRGGGGGVKGERVTKRTNTRPIGSSGRVNNCECPECRVLQRAGLPLDKKTERHSCHIPGCDKVYTRSSHLKAHLKWHNTDRPATTFQRKRHMETGVSAASYNSSSSSASDMLSSFN